jgi:hypothetical protein
MAQNENPDPNPAEEPAIARQARAIEKIDRLVKGDEPIGEKLKDAVDDHSQACDERAIAFSGRQCRQSGQLPMAA